MKTNKRKEQFLLAEALFEMGMDYEVIENISNISPEELLLNKINMIDFSDQKSNNLKARSKEKKS